MKTAILAVGLLAVFVGLLICLRQFCVEKPPPIVVIRVRARLSSVWRA